MIVLVFILRIMSFSTIGKVPQALTAMRPVTMVEIKENLDALIFGLCFEGP